MPKEIKVASVEGKLADMMKESGNTAKAIFVMAELFRDAGFILDQRAGACDVDALTRMRLMVPVTVITAFTVELLLKCLIYIETEKKIWIHDIGKLFGGLSNESQQWIEEYYNELDARSEKVAVMKQRHSDLKTDLKSVLESSANTFAQWRYAYESEIKPVVGLGRLLQAVRARILALIDDWPVLVSSEPVVVNPHAEFVERKNKPSNG
jgi:hypothetical protein